ncbi:hypothetical protein [Flavobacterium sp. WC2430]|uniref:hypothetical protein n=1 Tax=Flavobacterium sp. WC2430 TaxID=3234137 RepID=UPI0034673B51
MESLQQTRYLKRTQKDYGSIPKPVEQQKLGSIPKPVEQQKLDQSQNLWSNKN